MRVIAGKARSLKLKSVEGRETRPTQDRIKETLFNMLQFDLEGSVFLDLFAGSGAIGIEALSRGAKRAVFVEKNRKAAGCIRENLSHTGFSHEGRVMEMDVLPALDGLSVSGEVFDFIFMDPPYKSDLLHGTLEVLAKLSVCTAKTTVIAETDLHGDVSKIVPAGFSVVKVKTYKTNKHIFLQKISEVSP